ncbi:agmatine ureohydrolase [Thermoplasma volcanium GSS1]|uniref:Agmatine ureohydrolase n=1 Tax=Thermoplasma volcanium (strain ATCC 51530 / DSM 4299 / JCM 9571 / NBRC 15438 / GSS1) TaxID=273116 RepID=Q97BB8_THEVO|nr:agmatinase [Thermoplasma volcanium]BAB59680.1 agmatine ureohydrolase [Thermoplasma volcanium GSS1]
MGGNGREKDHASELRSIFSLKKIADAVNGYEEAKYVVFGIPFDNTSSYRRGSKYAPDSIRGAYVNLESYEYSYGIDLLASGMADLGDMEESEDVEYVIDTVESVVSAVMSDGKIPIMLGGEHSITVGAVRALPKDVDLVIVDAHSDFRSSYMGNKYNHACVTRRALDLLGEGRITSIGIRSVSREEFEDPDFRKVSFISSFDVKKNGIDKYIEEVDRKSRRVYISVDMDGIDPAYAPAVGTPEPFGLADTDVRRLIERLSYKAVGFDIVEFSPLYDNGNTSMLAAKLLQVFIASREKYYKEHI